MAHPASYSTARQATLHAYTSAHSESVTMPIQRFRYSPSVKDFPFSVIDSNIMIQSFAVSSDSFIQGILSVSSLSVDWVVCPRSSNGACATNVSHMIDCVVV